MSSFCISMYGFQTLNHLQQGSTVQATGMTPSFTRTYAYLLCVRLIACAWR